MDKYNIELQVVFNGKHDTLNGKFLLKDTNTGNVRRYLTDKIKATKIMDTYVFKKYGLNIHFKANICGDCVNMLRCPKVRDKEKRPLENYPYITDGLEILLIDKEIRKQYQDALEEYKERSSADDFYLDNDEDLNLKLSDSGVEVPVISVFKCSNFIPEEESAFVKAPRKRR